MKATKYFCQTATGLDARDYLQVFASNSGNERAKLVFSASDPDGGIDIYLVRSQVERLALQIAQWLEENASGVSRLWEEVGDVG